MDNLFTSVSTFRQIGVMGHGACGTWKPRAGAQIPDELLPAGFEAARTADQGDGVQMGDVHGPMYADSGLVAWAWMDSAHINFLTTIHQTDEVGTLARRSSASLARGQQGSGRADRAAPLCAICYNKKMLGTDKCDQMRGTYSPQRRSNKPWKALFIWTLDVACVNAWALWNKSTRPKVIRTASRLEFQRRLVEELLGVQTGGRMQTTCGKLRFGCRTGARGLRKLGVGGRRPLNPMMVLPRRMTTTCLLMVPTLLTRTRPRIPRRRCRRNMPSWRIGAIILTSVKFKIGAHVHIAPSRIRRSIRGSFALTTTAVSTYIWNAGGLGTKKSWG